MRKPPVDYFGKISLPMHTYGNGEFNGG